MSGDRTHSLHQVHISKSSFSPMKPWLAGGCSSERVVAGIWYWRLWWRGLQERLQDRSMGAGWREKPAMTGPGRPSFSSLSPGSSNSPFPGWRSCQECQGRPGTELGRRGPLRPTMAGQRRSHNPLSANISVHFLFFLRFIFKSDPAKITSL